MKETEQTRSFEPRRLREAVEELKRLERRLTRESAASQEEPGELPRAPMRPPGRLVRWWRLLFGSAS